MMKILSKVFIFSLLLAFTISLAHTQTIPTGKLDGYVTDNENAPLPGTTVTISSPSLISPQISIVTKIKGYYRFIGLPSGAYQVKFEMPGMKTVIREGISVTAGRTTTLGMILELSPFEETVVIVGKAPTIDLQSTATGVTFGKEVLRDLPVSRKINAVADLAPGMYNQTSFGSDQLTNRYLVDGLNQSNPLFGVLINEVGFSSIEELTVSTGMHKAEYGAVKGAVVQVITKSGGNNFSGDVGIYLKQKSFQSDNTKGTPFEGMFVGFDHDYEPYLSLGGPIKSDKVWFFTSFDIRHYRYYFQGYPWDSTEHIAINVPEYRPFGKVTWQISSKDKLTSSFHYFYTNYDRWPTRFMTVESTHLCTEKGATYSTQWTRSVSSNFLFNVRFGYLNYTEDRGLRSNSLAVRELSTGNNSGSKGHSYVNKRGRLQFSTDAMLFVDDWFGAHELKVGGGVDFSGTNAHKEYVQDPRWVGVFGPTFRVSRVYLDDGEPNRLNISEDTYRKYRDLNVGFFVQDTWTLSKRLTLNLGVRYDFSQNIWPPQQKQNTDIWVYEKTTIPLTWHTLAPRLGISFDPIGNGKTVLRVSYGRYNAPMMAMLTNLVHRGQATSFKVALNPDWTENYRYGLNEPSTAEGVDPDGVSPYYNDEFNFAFEWELFKNMSLGVTLIGKWEKNMIEGVDINHIDKAYLKEHGLDNGVPRWTGYNLVQGTDPLTGNPVTFYSIDPAYPTGTEIQIMNIPGIFRKYRGLEIKLNKRMSNNWAMFASYVWGRGIGLLGTGRFDSDAATSFFNEPNVHINAWGTLKHQKEHVFKFQGNYLAPLGIQLSVQYVFASGEPYPRQLRSSEAGATLYQGRVTILAEPYGSYYYPNTHILDFRVEKAFNVGPGQFSIMGDVFSALNMNTTNSVGWRTDVDWQNVTQIVNPRYFRLGFSYRF